MFIHIKDYFFNMSINCKICIVFFLFISLIVSGCTESNNNEIEYPNETPKPQQKINPTFNYNADTSAIRSEISAQGYTVHKVDFARNSNGVYVLQVMIDTKGNYDKEVLDAYKIMHKNGVADYYLVGIADYEILSSSSFTATKKTLDDFFSGKITEDEYIRQVKSETLI